MNAKHLLFLLCTLVAIACQPSGGDDTPAVAFYYWRTTFDLTPTERRVLEDCDVKHLYIRYFDVKIDPASGAIVPEAPVRFRSLPPKGIRVTPVVFITNRVMLRRETNVDTLAANIAAYIRRINRAVGLPEPDEVQIDCDWSTGSRDRFMLFIDTLKRHGGFRNLSATIRLHQAKHHTITRIPGVDRGVLMYYNMGSVETDTVNSIYDRKIAKRYLGSLKVYPLPMDVALPIYAWGVHLSEGRVTELINRIHRADFEQDTNILVSRGSNLITVKHSLIKGGRYYRTGDEVRIEEVTSKDLLEMARDLSRHMSARPREVVFFDLDEHHFNKYITNYESETNFFKDVVRCF